MEPCPAEAGDYLDLEACHRKALLAEVDLQARDVDDPSHSFVSAHDWNCYHFHPKDVD